MTGEAAANTCKDFVAWRASKYHSVVATGNVWAPVFSRALAHENTKNEIRQRNRGIKKEEKSE